MYPSLTGYDAWKTATPPEGACEHCDHVYCPEVCEVCGECLHAGDWTEVLGHEVCASCVEGGCPTQDYQPCEVCGEWATLKIGSVTICTMPECDTHKRREA